MKKVLLFVILSLLLCSMAQAEPAYFTIDEVREQAAAWQSVYTTKWRDVEVNIVPTVPDVHTMPVLMVRPAFWVPVPSEQNDWYITQGAPDAFTAWSGNMYQIEHTVGKSVDDYSYYVYAPLDHTTVYAPANTMTIDGFIDIVQRFLNTVEHPHFELDTQHILYARIAGYTDKTTGEQMMPALIHTDCLYTMIRQIPIFGHVIMSVNKWKDEELFYEPRITAIVRNEDEYEIMVRTVRESTELADDVPLCSYDTVIAVLESEIEAGHIRAVYSLDLGYALYNVANTSRKPGWSWTETAEFYAAPTWRCVCLYSKEAKKEVPGEAYDDPYPSLYYKEVYVNAQTGEFVDPTNNRKGCGDYPGLITWNDIRQEK